MFGCSAAAHFTPGDAGSDGLLSLCDPLDLDRVEAEYLHVHRSRSPLVIAARRSRMASATGRLQRAGDGQSVRK
jgi:hypothetical protein